MCYYIPVSHDMMHQTNDCSPVRVMQHKVMYFDPALGPVALGLGRPGALPAGLVQPCPKPRALFHKHGMSVNTGVWPETWFSPNLVIDLCFMSHSLHGVTTYTESFLVRNTVFVSSFNLTHECWPSILNGNYLLLFKSMLFVEQMFLGSLGSKKTPSFS